MDGVPFLFNHPSLPDHPSPQGKQNPRQRKLSGVLHIVKAKTYFLS